MRFYKGLSLAVVAVLFMASCDSKPKYEFHTVSAGSIHRFNVKTGEAEWCVNKRGCVSITQAEQTK